MTECASALKMMRGVMLDVPSAVVHPFHILVGKAQGRVPFEGIAIVIHVELLLLHSLDYVWAAV